jgi:calcineurin-like phosphoesterase family protein
MNQIYFTADLHFGHSNILKHSPKRPFSDTVDIVAHDEWLLDLWKNCC